MTNWEELALKLERQEWRELAASIAFTVLALLDKQGMTKQQLAKKMGVKPQYVSRVVKGKANITLDTITKLEKALGESIISVSDPTVKISASTPTAVIVPNTQWKVVLHRIISVKESCNYDNALCESEICVNNDDYSLAS